MRPAQRRVLVQNGRALLPQDRVGEDRPRDLDVLRSRLRRGRLGGGLLHGLRGRLCNRLLHNLRGGLRRRRGGGFPARGGQGVRGFARQCGGRRGHRLVREIELHLGRFVGQVGGFGQGGALAARGVLRLLQFVDHLGQKVQQRVAALFHGGNAGLEVLQPQAVGVLDLPRFVGGGLHQLARLVDGLVARHLVDGLGLAVGVFQQGFGLVAGFLADLLALGVGGGQYLVALVLHFLARLVAGAALDAQRGLGVLGALGQFFVVPRKVAVFQPLHGHLVGQRVVARFQRGAVAFQLVAAAGGGVGLAGQRGVLGAQRLVLAQQRLAAAAQRVAFLPGGAGLGRGAGQRLFIITAQRAQRLAHILRLIAAKARPAHAALFHILVDINVCHKARSPGRKVYIVLLYGIHRSGASRFLPHAKTPPA